MKITGIKFAKLSIPLITPFKTSMRSVDHVQDIVVMVTTSTGNIGYGSATSTPVITGDTHASLIAAIDTLIKPKILGLEIENLNGIVQIIQTSMVGNYSAKAAIESAIYDLWGQLYKAPLYKLLGGGNGQLSTDVTISVNAIDKMVSDSMLAISQGFDILKIKIGTDLYEDIERVKEIYQAIRDKALLRLDVNQGWSAKETVFAIQKLEQAGVELELIEQPVKAHDFAGMKYVSERVITPLMADESAFSAKDVINLIQTGAADIINIKLVKTGGISNAIRIADIAAIYNVECMIGCMLEGSVGISAAAHLAVAKSNIITKIDLDGPILGQYNPVVGGLTCEHAKIVLNETPGLGIESVDGLIELKTEEIF